MGANHINQTCYFMSKVMTPAQSANNPFHSVNGKAHHLQCGQRGI